MKEFLIVCLAAILSLACITGCSGGQPNKPNGPASIDVDENVEATLTIATKTAKRNWT